MVKFIFHNNQEERRTGKKYQAQEFSIENCNDLFTCLQILRKFLVNVREYEKKNLFCFGKCFGKMQYLPSNVIVYKFDTIHVHNILRTDIYNHISETFTLSNKEKLERLDKAINKLECKLNTK